MPKLGLFFTYGVSLEDWYNNGSIEREVDIYKRLLSHFDEICFFTYGRNDLAYEKYLPEKIKLFPKKSNLPDPIYSIVFPFLYRKEIRKLSWIKTNQMLGSWSAIVTKIFLGKKVLVRTGYTLSLNAKQKNNRSFTEKLIFPAIEYFACKNATVISVSTDFQKKYLEKKFKTKNIEILPNGIDTRLFSPRKTTNKNGKATLLFVGRLHPEKNILNLLRAASELKNIHLTIIGKGEMRGEIEKMGKKLNLDLDIIDSVPNSKLPSVYNSHDIYIQPSLYEGNPKTILEAMSCGMPVIASDVNGIRELIEHKKTGYLCSTETQLIKEALLELIKNLALAEEVGENARIYIEQNYNLDEVIKKEITIYKNI